MLQPSHVHANGARSGAIAGASGVSTATGLGAETGATTPATGLESGMTSGQATPGESDEDVNMDGEGAADGGARAGGGVKKEDGGLTEADIMPKGEVFTCECILPCVISTGSVSSVRPTAGRDRFQPAKHSSRTTRCSSPEQRSLTWCPVLNRQTTHPPHHPPSSHLKSTATSPASTRHIQTRGRSCGIKGWTCGTSYVVWYVSPSSLSLSFPLFSSPSFFVPLSVLPARARVFGRDRNRNQTPAVLWCYEADFDRAREVIRHI